MLINETWGSDWIEVKARTNLRTSRFASPRDPDTELAGSGYDLLSPIKLVIRANSEITCQMTERWRVSHGPSGRLDDHPFPRGVVVARGFVECTNCDAEVRQMLSPTCLQGEEQDF